MRTLLLTLTTLLVFIATGNAQDCGNCGPREIVIYNFDIQLPIPVADHDSIMNYYNALKVTSAVTDYLKTSDPTHDCIITEENCAAARYLTPERALSEPGVLVQLGTLPIHTPRSDPPDYYVTGFVAPSLASPGKYFVDIMLISGTGGKHVAGGFAGLDTYPSGDVTATVATAMSQKFGPARDKIREFEVAARDGGAPYAIRPALTLTAGKPSLEFHEQTTVHISLRDCDDVPLPNRTVTLTAEGGTLDQTSVTTDNNGTADVIFTAGSTAQIAIVTPGFSYTKPCDKPGTPDLTPLAISIKKPSDCWFIQIVHTMDDRVRNSSYSAALGTQQNETHTHNSTFIAAWIRGDVYTLPFVGTKSFVSRIGFVDLKYRITEDEGGTGSSFWSNSAGYIKENSHYNIGSQSITSPSAEQLVSIDDENCSVSFTGFDATQTGNYYLTRDTWDLINGYQHTDATTPADPTRGFEFNVNDASRDTTYNSVTTSNIFGLHETMTASVTQKCTWKLYTDSTLQFSRKWQDVTDDRYDTLGLVDNHYWAQEHRAYITMYCNPAHATGVMPGRIMSPTSFNLRQNYPNPFNPSTNVRFEIGDSRFVRLSVFDVLGREVAVLVNEVMPAGVYSVVWNAAGIPSGVYYCRMSAGTKTAMIKMMLMR